MYTIFLKLFFIRLAFSLFFWMIEELVRTVHGDFSLTLMALSLIILMDGTVLSEFSWRLFLKNLEVC